MQELSTQLINTHITEAYLLKKSLSNFGLHPDDWLLLKCTHISYKIINVSEPGFIFKGYIRDINGKKTWSSIHLLSI